MFIYRRCSKYYLEFDKDGIIYDGIYLHKFNISSVNYIKKNLWKINNSIYLCLINDFIILDFYSKLYIFNYKKEMFIIDNVDYDIFYDVITNKKNIFFIKNMMYKLEYV